MERSRGRKNHVFGVGEEAVLDKVVCSCYPWRHQPNVHHCKAEKELPVVSIQSKRRSQKKDCWNHHHFD